MINMHSLPPDIIESTRAVLWNRETRDGKPTKVPYQAHRPARKAAVNDPATWASMREAVAAHEDGKGDGVGIVLGDGLVGVDLDHVRDAETGEITREALDIVAGLRSYTEISPSGTGVHILLRGELPPGGRKDGSTEMYCTGRYFTVTGQHLAGTPTTIEERTAELGALHARVSPDNGHGKGRSTTPRPATPLDLDDAGLLDRACSAINGAKFTALWGGDISAHGSHSEADQALCNLLAFWTGADAGRIDRLFRQSGLMREKWDERRGERTYGEITIAKAIAGCHETYTEGGRRPSTTSSSTGASSSGAAEADSGSEAAPEPLSEAGAAERFARLHGHELRFDWQRGRWLLWSGHRWAPDVDGAIDRLVLSFARAWQHDAVDAVGLSKAERDRLFTFTHGLDRNTARAAVLTLARSLRPIATAGDTWDLDPWLLGVPNGVLDLRTGLLRPGVPADNITLQAGVAFDPDARCPRFELFMQEIFYGDHEMVSFVHRLAGYSLTGVCGEQVFPICWGGGSNGKGTLLNTLRHVLSDYAGNAPFSTFEMRDRAAIPNDLADLQGRRFVTASETNRGARLNEARVKMLTGEDPVTARHLHCEFFTFIPTCKLWFAVNDKPVVADDSYGFWRRVRLLPFTRTFSVDGSLKGVLEAESRGILGWLLRGCLAWQNQGLGPIPAAVTEGTKAYQEESDVLADFVRDCLEADPEATTGATELFRCYQRWEDAQGLARRDRLTQRGFGQRLEKKFTRNRQGGSGRAQYLGVRCLP